MKRASLAQDMYLSTVIGDMLNDFIDEHIDPAIKEDGLVFGTYEGEARVYYSKKSNSSYDNYFVGKHTDKALDVIRKVYDLGILDEKKFNDHLMDTLLESERHRGIAEATVKFLEDTRDDR